VTVVLGLVLGLLLGLAGCSSSEDSGGVDAGLPSVGDCRTYDGAAAERATDVSGPVPCDGPHSAQTTTVSPSGLPDPGADGRWTHDQLEVAGALACGPARLADDLGLTVGGLAATRIVQAFFGPTPEQAKAGARWVRCDAFVTSGGEPVKIAKPLAELVQVPGAFAQCATSPPPAERKAVRCEAGRGLWAAVGAVEAGQSAAPAGLEKTCRARYGRAVTEGAGRWTVTAADVPVAGEQATFLCWLPFAQWNVDPATWPREVPVTTGSAT